MIDRSEKSMRACGRRLFMSGRYSEAQALRYCRANNLPPEATAWVLDGRQVAEDKYMGRQSPSERMLELIRSSRPGF